MSTVGSCLLVHWVLSFGSLLPLDHTKLQIVSLFSLHSTSNLSVHHSNLFTMLLSITSMLMAVSSSLAVLGVDSKRGSRKSAAKKGSPMKKDLTTISITSKKKMKKSIYYLRIMGFKAPNFEAIWCEKPNVQGQDAFLHPFQRSVTDTLDQREEGFIGTALRRMSHDENRAATNSGDGFLRKFVIRATEESTHATRIAALNVVKAVSVHL